MSQRKRKEMGSFTQFKMPLERLVFSGVTLQHVMIQDCVVVTHSMERLSPIFLSLGFYELL